MRTEFERADALSQRVIGAAITVHRALGPGLLESVYERCLMRELEIRRLRAVKQKSITVEYKGISFRDMLRFDILVEDCLLVELKAVQQIVPLHKAQLMSYMRLLNVPMGLLMNFHELKLVDGLQRLILPELSP